MGKFEEPKNHRNEQVFSAPAHAHNLPRRASKNTNENITSDILVALHEGCGHLLDLHLKPVEEVG
jgi:hypothetical protein